jgi:hypothetical protein
VCARARVCVCVCVCVCAVYLWTGLGFLSFVEVVFSIGVSKLRMVGVFMVGGSLRGCQRLRWGIWYARRLGDCLLCILRVCEIVRLCSCGLLSCDIAISA